MGMQSILRFLDGHFGGVEELRPVGAGMFSRAYSFRTGGKEFILRINRFREDFLKDEYAWRAWASPDIPIPEVIAIGEMRGGDGDEGLDSDEGLYYAITRHAPGRTLARMEADELYPLIPEIFRTLDAIRKADISRNSGCGLMDAAGHGIFHSWPDYLRARHNQKFAHDWEGLAEHPFFERELYERLRSEMEMLLDYVPAEKYLVHGDFGFDNVIADNGKITGVLDWAESQLGDFLYDIAYLDFWSNTVPYEALWRNYAEGREYDLSHFEERMRCYNIHIGMESLAIAATRNDREDYYFVRELILRGSQQ